MSTSSVSSSSSGSSGYMLSSLAGSSSMQVTGLASGLNTNQIISEEMSLYNQPVVNLQNQQSGLNATNKALQGIQSELQTLANDAQALGATSLFTNSQTASSTNPTLLSATTTSNNGAVVGGYQVQVSALATSAQRTFSFSSPTSAQTVTIDGQSISLAAGASADDFANAVNANSNADVWAAVTNAGTVVLSDRATGQQTGSYISVSDPSGTTLTEQTALANAGQDASFTVNGKSKTSPSNTVTSAIPGVSLSLNGVTPSGSPVTVNVGPPAVNSANIQNALNTFITQYNKVIGDIQTQLSTQPSSSDPTVGTLYGDPGLQGLLSSMRSSLYNTISGTQSGLTNMLSLGVSTGATTGSGSVSQSALSGDLQLSTTTLTSALQSNPAGVQQLLKGFSASFSSMVNAEAQPGGSIDTRIQGDSAEVTQLGSQISAMQSALNDKQQQLVQQFAQLEAALSQNQSTSSWLTNQLASLPGA